MKMTFDSLFVLINKTYFIKHVRNLVNKLSHSSNTTSPTTNTKPMHKKHTPWDVVPKQRIGREGCQGRWGVFVYLLKDY